MKGNISEGPDTDEAGRDSSPKNFKKAEAGGRLSEKIKALEAEVNEAKSLAEERLSQMKYMQAEFDNYRKWSEKEKATFAKNANLKLIKDILPSLDEFERAVFVISDETSKKGLEMAEKNLFKALKSHGLERIDCLEKPFDPYLHEAILKKESDKDEDLVIEEIQPGWMLNGEVIRHSKVVVSGGRTS